MQYSNCGLTSDAMSSANLKAMMTKKVPKEILRIERNLFVNLRKNCFWPPRPPTEIDQRAAAADTMTSAHSSITFNRNRPGGLLPWLDARVRVDPKMQTLLVNQCFLLL